MTSHAITRQRHLLDQESKQTLRIRAVCIFTLGFWLLDVTWPWKLLGTVGSGMFRHFDEVPLK